MPTPRKSCLRCRADKARCSYIPGDQACTRCTQRQIACELPVGHKHSLQELSTNGTDGSPSQTAALNQRIGKIEELLVELKSALPVSARNANYENRSVDDPVNVLTTMPEPRVDRSSRPGPSSALPTRCSLPPMEVAQALLTDYLRDFNSRIPLLAPEAIVSHMRDCYSGAAKGIATSWVLTHFVFGIAHRLRALDPAVRSEETSKTEEYLDKCLDSFSNVLLEEPSERTVQCLLGIAIMLQDSQKSHRVSSFVSVALRMAQELGYNEISDSDNKVPGYLFWIAFFLDANLSMCSLKPNTQKHAEIMTSLPRADNNDWWNIRPDNNGNTMNGIPGTNFFFLHCSLALLQAEALETVFSPKASVQLTQYNLALHTLITKLAAWRSDSKVNSAEGLQSADVLHAAMLEASYFRTMYQLVAAQQIGVVTFRFDLFSHIALRVQKYYQRSPVFEDARKLLSLLSSPAIEIVSLNR